MAAPTNIKRKAEDAFEALINQMKGSNLSGWQIVKGFSGTALTVPRIHIVARRRSVEMLAVVPDFTQDVTIEVGVISHYTDTTRAAHDLAEGVISDIFFHDRTCPGVRLIERINNLLISDFKAIQWNPDSDEDSVSEDRKNHITLFTGILKCNDQTL